MAGVAAITSFLPLTISGLIFSSRRLNKAIEADDPMVSIMNLDIATGQVFKASECAMNIAEESKKNNIIPNLMTSAEENIKNASKGAKALQAAEKAIKFTADHINPIIMVTSGVKIATSDDKERTAMTEVPAVATMLFVGEPAYKKLTGIAKNKRVNGKLTAIEQEALYKKNPFLKKQAEALNDFCATKKFLKHAPKVLKGLGFVGASICSYELGKAAGTIAADKILGEKNSSEQNLFARNEFKQTNAHAAA